ncbi:hypothetical protein BWQ96_02059 [Gracilariopsis chorda]|uniref:Tyrosine-protein phosphatase n=1 Tax=Gracilariopsis chorda TaxID=448386 RepID=A0A2V3J288_9FLOR|nr:hypothetical protein BWQ96_02059 [Gracilariopsis chorda]|eukprot:PXF48107.1 hypothetical protein BWQ96_02059 [Gracilariopsis chorda]
MAQLVPLCHAALPPLIPPFRFCQIEHALFRGGHPSLKNMRFMRRLKLRTIISLLPQDSGPSQDLVEYCRAERIRHIWHHVDKYDDGFSHTPRLVSTLLSHMIDATNHPLFLHCRDGGHNTGLVVMCLRRLQNWNLSSIFEEFMRYTKNNLISFAEKQFVECFNTAVTIPPCIPTWLWDGVRHKRHPFIQLQLQSSRSCSRPSPPARARNASNSHDANLFECLVGNAPGGVPRGAEHGMHPRQRSSHVNVEVHYSRPVAALDVLGVHFKKCCRSEKCDCAKRTRQ